MRVVLQRVSEANVKINDVVKGEIDHGFVVLLGITPEDTEDDVLWLAQKICNQRVFSDEEGKMNLSIKDINGSLLIVSQFTLYASTKKGNRPSFIKSAKPEIAIPLYEKFIRECSLLIEKPIQTGEFGADMKVSLTNDGPVTIIIDSKNKE